MNKQRIVAITVVLFGFAGISCRAADARAPAQNSYRSMLVGTLRLPDEAFLAFVEQAKPDFVVMGAFGAPQWAAEDDVRQWITKWRAVFDRMHRSNVKVIGMIELLNVGNSLKEAERFLDFYENRWDERLLGARPKVTGKSLLEARAIPAEKQVGAHAPRGCAVNPNWRAVEKTLVKAMIDAGIDGFITHRNMFGECGCPFCHAESAKVEEAKGRRPKVKARRSHPQPKGGASPDNRSLAPRAEQNKRRNSLGPGDQATEPVIAKLAGRVSESPCDHCSRGFRRWLADRYDLDQLKTSFGINNLKSHRFAANYGHHRDHEKLPTPIQLEGMKFARHAIKECFDDVFVKFGRGLKKDLIVAQWNHMPYFDELHLDGGHIPRWKLTTFAHASADERWSLPIDLWGRAEDFYWYCNWGTCQNTQLDKRFLADVTLYAKLLRSFARGKPYVINKYDFYRPRNMMAEAAALGMIPGAIKVPYSAAKDSQTMSRYFQFLRRHRDLFAASNGQTIADVLLVYPRSRTNTGDASGLEMIEVAGRSMISSHVQFDFVPDELLGGIDFKKYRAIVASSPTGLDEKKLELFFQSGGSVIAVPRDKKQAEDPKWRELGAKVISGLAPHSGGTPAAKPLLTAIVAALGKKHPRFEAPYTVEAHVYRQPGRLVAHLVNYNHTEKAAGRSVVEREAPIAAKPIRIELPLPNGMKVRRVRFLNPDADKPVDPEFTQRQGVVTFQTPSFLVYGICVVELENE